MSIKRAKLNLDFGRFGTYVNVAIEKDADARTDSEKDWNIVSFKIDADFLDSLSSESTFAQRETNIQKKTEIIEKKLKEWQKDNGYDFDSVAEVTISAAYFDVMSFRYAPGFEEKLITEEDVRKMELCKQKDVAAKIQMPDKTRRIFVSPYFLLSNEKRGMDLVKVPEPAGHKATNFGFHAYFITENYTISKIIEIMKKAGDNINVSLSCEKELKALANEKERAGKTLLINITDSISEFSIWDNSDIKYLNKKETGLRELKNLIWRLCLCYYRVGELIDLDYELTQDDREMQNFYERVKNIKIDDDSKELLSADDCFELLKFASCTLDRETEHSIKVNRLALPGKNGSKTNKTISNYVLSYFVRKAMHGILSEIKQTIDNDEFCEPNHIIFECSLPLKGIERLATEVFGIPARKEVAKWDKESKEGFSVAGIGALKDLLARDSGKTKEKKRKTLKLSAIFSNIFNRA
ncbi:MAG: hypothetical protein LBC85_11200 [Fibromonadaceae bacterium]|jgi:hypothetical protein|nr:hypothetical protein [Fibromonadaceae bacterium]